MEVWRKSCGLFFLGGIHNIPYHPLVRYMIYLYTWNPNDPCFDCIFGLVLGGEPSKIEVSLGFQVYIYTSYTRFVFGIVISSHKTQR